ncbi:hypothetical protein Gogos_010762 [Gossypium gossypioides]|uniref:RNase H type-1 domain-containing protein n=1 Tax=Gossypium gossypioides TaxID=34282 RepID=A0A7J9BM75_GOSGO|nr:hypothetical protein [Gossypium gossypioides]
MQVLTNGNRKEEIAITIWAIWFSRNKFLHKRKVLSVEEVVTFVRGYGREYQELSSTLKHLKPRAMINWYPPPPNWVKVNVDARFSATKQKAIAGFIIRNYEGHLVKSIVFAEAIAILHGIQFALEISFMQIVLKIDSNTVIKKSPIDRGRLLGD